MGKLFERIINERATGHLDISDMQGGGKKGSNTTDHVLIFIEAIKKGKDVYIAFLDVTKAYNQTWADVILCVLEKMDQRTNCGKKFKKFNKDLVLWLRLVLLRFAKKSPTSSPGTEIDVGRPDINVLNIFELQNLNSGTMQRTEMADHLLESLERKKDRTAA